MKSSSKNNLIGVLVDGIDRQTAIEMVMEAARQGRGFSVSALAVHGVMSGVLDVTHRYRLNHLDLVVADGQPVRWALNLLHSVGLRQRVYGPALTLDVIQRAAEEGISVYLYGSTQEVITLLCASLRQRFPGIKIAGAEPSQFVRIARKPRTKSPLGSNSRAPRLFLPAWAVPARKFGLTSFATA